MQKKKRSSQRESYLKVFEFFSNNNVSLSTTLGTLDFHGSLDGGGKNLADRLEKSKHHRNQLFREIPGLPHFLHGPPPIEPPPIGTLDGPGMSEMASLGQ